MASDHLARGMPSKLNQDPPPFPTMNLGSSHPWTIITSGISFSSPSHPGSFFIDPLHRFVRNEPEIMFIPVSTPALSPKTPLRSHFRMSLGLCGGVRFQFLFSLLFLFQDLSQFDLELRKFYSFRRQPERLLWLYDSSGWRTATHGGRYGRNRPHI